MSALLTSHARMRLQQRAIPTSVVDLLYDYGAESHCGGGATRLRFDRRSREHLRKRLNGDGLKRIERWLGIYMIVGNEGQVVTVARTTRRFRHN